VKVVPQVKYLGVQIDRKLIIAGHVNHVKDKAKSLAVKLKSLEATRWDEHHL